MLKRTINRLLRPAGLELRRIAQGGASLPGSPARPIGSFGCFLEDLKARGFAPRGVLDVGANRGDWTRHFQAVFPNTPTVMIEPQDEMEPLLTSLARTLKDGHYVKAGAGRTEGELVQTIWDDLAGSSFLPAVQAELMESRKQRRTKIVTIDGLLAQRFPDFVPSFVKLDIQGCELEALAGAQGLFGVAEVFLLETSLFPLMPGQPITREIIAYLADRGYELYDISEYLRRPYDGALGQVDLVFVARNGPLRAVQTWNGEEVKPR